MKAQKKLNKKPSFAPNTILQLYHEKKIDSKEFAIAKRLENDYFFSISGSLAQQNLSISRSGGRQEAKEPLQAQIEAARRITKIKQALNASETLIIEMLIERELSTGYAATKLRLQEKEIIEIFKRALFIVSRN